MSPVYFTPLAEADLELIGDYIAQDSTLRALSYVRELRAQCQKIASAPLRYRARTELAQGLRSCTYGQYVIFFMVRDGGISVIRILHRAQDIQATFTE